MVVSVRRHKFVEQNWRSTFPPCFSQRNLVQSNCPKKIPSIGNVYETIDGSEGSERGRSGA